MTDFQRGWPEVTGGQVAQLGTRETPFDEPQRGATWKQANRRLFSKYFTFLGRASQSEYLWGMLTIMSIRVTSSLVLVGTIVTDMVLDAQGIATPEVVALFGLGQVIIVHVAFLVPELSLTARRLHDANFSGWWQALAIAIPAVAWPLVLVAGGALPPKPDGARFDWVA